MISKSLNFYIFAILLLLKSGMILQKKFTSSKKDIGGQNSTSVKLIKQWKDIWKRSESDENSESSESDEDDGNDDSSGSGGQCEDIVESSGSDENNESSESIESSESSENGNENGDEDDGSFIKFKYNPMNGPKYCYCGAPNTQHMDSLVGQDFIEGGDVTEDYEYPWQVSLLYYNKKPCDTDIPLTARAKCGGTLVTDLHVITAAHCLFNFHNGIRHKENDIKILLGESNLLSDGDKGMIVGVKEFKIAKRWFENDIAVIELNKRINLTQYPNIKPVCLPILEPGEKRPVNGWYQNNTAIVSGWGRNTSIYHKKRANSKPSKLKELHVRIVGRKNCGHFSKMKTFDKQNTSYLLDGLFCGYSGGEGDSCKGDSGGPLITNDEDNLGAATLIGVVSRGYTNCSTKQPYQLYMSIKYFLMEPTGWLNESLKGGRRCPSYPGGIWSKNLDDPTQNRLHPINMKNVSWIDSPDEIVNIIKNGKQIEENVTQINISTGAPGEVLLEGSASAASGSVSGSGSGSLGEGSSGSPSTSGEDSSGSSSKMGEDSSESAPESQEDSSGSGSESGEERSGSASESGKASSGSGDSLCVEDNVVYLGKDINDTGKKVPNEQGCNMYCEEVSECETWVYHKESKTCQLKIFHGNLTKITNNAYASGLKDCFEVPTSVPIPTTVLATTTVSAPTTVGSQLEDGGSLCMKDNYVYLGEGVNNTGKKVRNNQECNMYCEEVTECEIWVYHKERKTCQLKIFHDHIRIEGNNAYVSGLKDCSKGVPQYCKDKVLQAECQSNKKLKENKEFNHKLNDDCEYCETGIDPSGLRGHGEPMPADQNSSNAPTPAPASPPTPAPTRATAPAPTPERGIDPSGLRGSSESMPADQNSSNDTEETKNIEIKNIPGNTNASPQARIKNTEETKNIEIKNIPGNTNASPQARIKRSCDHGLKDKTSRIDCGHNGISMVECLIKGCCYKRNKNMIDISVPECFFKS